MGNMLVGTLYNRKIVLETIDFQAYRNLVEILNVLFGNKY